MHANMAPKVSFRIYSLYLKERCSEWLPLVCAKIYPTPPRQNKKSIDSSPVFFVLIRNPLIINMILRFHILHISNYKDSVPIWENRFHKKSLLVWLLLPQKDIRSSGDRVNKPSSGDVYCWFHFILLEVLSCMSLLCTFRGPEFSGLQLSMMLIPLARHADYFGSSPWETRWRSHGESSSYPRGPPVLSLGMFTLLVASLEDPAPAGKETLSLLQYFLTSLALGAPVRFTCKMCVPREITFENRNGEHLRSCD